MHTYTVALHSIARNLDAPVQAALMKSSAPIYMPTLVEAGLTFVSDTTGNVASKCTRTIVFHDSATPGSMPAGAPMGQYLTSYFTGQVSTGIQAPVTADPVAIT